MPRFRALVLLIFILSSSVFAQPRAQAQSGDPPIISRINISPPDENGIVTMSGAAGAVFPGAVVAVRNLFTEQMAYAQAGLTGAFTAHIFGPGNTPFWVSPATAIPPALRDRPGSLPGGPGAIIYGSSSTGDPATTPTTQLILDGGLADWATYPAALLLETDEATVYGLRNSESLYVALESAVVPETYWQMQVIFSLEGATYRLSLDPRLADDAALLESISPVQRDRGPIGVAKTQTGAIEIRIPLDSLRPVLGAEVESGTLDRLEFVAEDDTTLLAIPVLQPLPPVDEVDGIVYESALDDSIGFTAAGPVAGGASTWQAQGRVNRLHFMPGESLRLQLDVTMAVPSVAEALAGINMIGQIGLQPISGPDGDQTGGGLNNNNGWSAVLTSGGLPVDNLRSDFMLGEAIVPVPRVLYRDDTLSFGLDFDLALPEDLPDGLYGLVFRGFARVGDDEHFGWEQNGLLGSGPGISRVYVTRLPLVTTIGEPETPRLIWALFQDDPSDGSRGVLAEEDKGRVALSNRVRFNSPTYILPPFAMPSGKPQSYPLEPYLIGQMPNAYDSTAAPVIPLLFPGGQLRARITRPDGSIDDLGRTTILQNQLSTIAPDERSRFGGQSQVDVYRLATLEPAYTNYQFDQYGPYTIELDGSVDDQWGNHYTGGGTYQVLVAEWLDMQTGALPGTPFEVGNSFQTGLTIAPAVAADVTITIRVFPLDGSPVIEREISGQANRNGYFVGDAVPLTTSGEYIVDYEARFTDSEGRLWAGSTRSAGVVANPENTLIAHGRRGLDPRYVSDYRPAWFAARQYGPEDAVQRLNFPYHSGDVLWYVAGGDNTVQPGITVHDTAGAYGGWASSTLADYSLPDGSTIEQRAIRGELPALMVSANQPGFNPVIQADALTSEAYTYLSAVRPGVTVRQFVLGTDDEGLLLHWDMNDPYNGQIGSGLKGDRVGDFVFLYGGAIIRNPTAGVADAAIFGATGFVTPNGLESPGARVYPPYRGAAGGADGGPLLTVRGEPVTMFFHPTGIRPGQVLALGDTLSIAGHVAPALDSQVQVAVTSPSGERRAYAGVANAIGWFYDPAQDFAVDEPGIWMIETRVQHTGWTSAGMVESPFPQGGVPGAGDGQFVIYVVPDDAPLLEWSDSRQDLTIPGALPFNFNFPLPEGWLNPKVDHTVTIPGYILQSGPLNISGASFSFQHNPTNLNAVFPNIEVDARLDGPAGSDPVTLTFVVTDENGQIRSRTFTILYDRLLTLES